MHVPNHASLSTSTEAKLLSKWQLSKLKMAMLKVNSIIAESHYNIVINKVAGNAISPLTLLTATSRERFQ